MNKNQRKISSRAFSLIEILVALTLMALVTGSIFNAFSTSRQMLFAAGELSKATSLAGSYLAAVTGVRQKDISTFPPAEDSGLPPAFRPETLKLPPAEEPFKRLVSVFAIDNNGIEGGPFYQVNVEITWTRKNSEGTPRYFSSTIIRGQP